VPDAVPDRVPDRAQATVDRIRLTGISATGYHGVLPDERRDGQTFVADVVLHVDTRAAAAADRLERTVDYAAVASGVAAVLAGEPADLVETVAERIAALALGYPGVAAVDVVVHKPQAPIPVPFADVAVEIHRSRKHLPVVAAPAPSGAPAEPAHAPAAEAPAPQPAPDLDALAAPLAAPVVAPLAGPAAAGAAPLPGTGLPSIADLVLPDDEPPALEPLDEPGAAPVAPAPQPDRMDAVPAEPVGVVIALGSNLGASQDTLRAAVHALAEVPGLEVTGVGPLARTAPVGGPDQPDFLNTVVLGRTTLSPRALLRACQAVEDRLGRVREERWGPRTLDVDLIVHGTTIGVTDDLELPHPRAHQRAFVLLPWAHVDPQAVLPGLGGGPVAALAETAPDRAGIRWVNLDWWSAG